MYRLSCFDFEEYNELIICIYNKYTEKRVNSVGEMVVYKCVMALVKEIRMLQTELDTINMIKKRRGL